MFGEEEDEGREGATRTSDARTKTGFTFTPIPEGRRRRPIYSVTWDIFLCPAPLYTSRRPFSPHSAILYPPLLLFELARRFNARRIGQYRGSEVAVVTAGWTPFLPQPPLVRSSSRVTYMGSLRASTLGSRGWPAGVGRLCNLHGRTPPFSGSNGQRENWRNGEGRSKDCRGKERLRQPLRAHGGWLTASLPTLLIVRARWPPVPRHCR